MNRRTPLRAPRPPHPDGLRIRRSRARRVSATTRGGCRKLQVDQDLPNRLRFAVVTEEFAAWAWDLAVATRIVQGDQVPEPPTRSIAEPFWYSNRSTPSLWFRRFRGHFTPVRLLSECSPVGGRAGCSTASRRVAGPFPRFLDASGDTDIDAYVGSDHTLYCPSRISRNKPLAD